MKKIIAFMFITMLIFSMSACGTSTESKADDEFLKDMANSLQTRWDLVIEDGGELSAPDDREHMEAYIDIEYNAISKYKDVDFENKNLGKDAKAYIELLEKSKECVKYYDTDFDRFYEEYNPINEKRAILITKIDNKYGLQINEKYNAQLEDMATTAELAKNVQSIIDDANFKETSNDDGWKVYECVIENETDQSFEYFSFNINLEDNDGVVVDTTIADTENWEPGAKHKFEFETDTVFDKTVIMSADY